MGSELAEARRYWGVVTSLPAPVIAMLAQQAEAQGLEGVFAPQGLGPPWVPLAVAAAHTQRIRIASGIAIAAARSPFETAMAAIDMDRISDGRFVLARISHRLATRPGGKCRLVVLDALDEFTFTVVQTLACVVVMSLSLHADDEALGRRAGGNRVDSSQLRAIGRSERHPSDDTDHHIVLELLGYRPLLQLPLGLLGHELLQDRGGV